MKLAALDVGSNTVLMLVVDSAGNVPRCVADFARITRLGRGVDATGHLDPNSAEQTLAAIAEFTEKARALGAEKIVGAATAALRDAAEGADFVARVKERAGVTLEIIDGKTEAQLSYLSTQKGLGLPPGIKLLIVDIGGGSTELIRSEPGRPLEVISLQIGSVRLTERIVRHDPPDTSEVMRLRTATADALRQLGWTYHPDSMVGIAGTVTTLSAITQRLEHYSSESVHGYRLQRTQLADTIAQLSSLPLEERKQLPGMEPGRADVLLAGAVILECVMEHFGCREAIVSDQGVRWGLIWRELERKSASRQQSAGQR